MNLLGDLGFSEARRVYETDNDTKIQENPNVSLSINYTKADVHINKERRKSLKWLKSAVPTNSTEINHRKFFSNKSTWQINPADSMTYLSVGPGAGVKGNLVWCDIATALHKNKSYRISITWVLKTTSKQVGLHLRNAETGKFVVIGSVSPQKKSVGSHTDNIDFIVRENGYTQLMLGALHFIGEGAGAEISKITLKSIVPVSSSEKIANLVEADRDRFLNSYAKGMVSHNIANARALLMFHSHSIEKGLSRNNFRAGFGKVAIPGLAREMKKWIKNDNDKNDSFFKIALSVLNAYFARHREVDFDVSNYWQLFDKEVQEMISNSANDIGGVMPSHVAREEVFSGYDRSFVDVVFGRRSIRVFNHEVVSDELIGKAVRMAMQAPSVCNRQPARVHCYRDSDLMNKALKYQGGWHGYKAPPTLLLVTSELSAYLFPDERNQGYIDGGLFLMNLILAFEAMGLGACSLNTAMSDEYSNKVRKILDVPDSQIFIAFVAVGHYEQGNLVPKSKRIEISEVLNIH